MNNVVLLGRLTADPEVRASADGKGMTTFSIAVNRSYKKDGGPDADFFRCVAFGRTADTIGKYFAKGRRICVHGEIHIDSYTNKDGVKMSSPSVVVNGFDFCDSTGGSAPAAQAKSKAKNDGFMKVDESFDDDFLPFA